MLTRIRSFLYGLLLPLTTLKVIAKHPRLLLWSFIPLALTSVLYFYLIQKLQARATESLLSALSGSGIQKYEIIISLINVIFKFTILILSAVVFSFVASIICAPFNDFLAEAAERYTDPALPLTPPLALRFQMRLILLDTLKMIASGVAALVALLLSWVPVLNVLALTTACLLICFQYVSYPQTRRGEGLFQSLGFLGRHFFSCLGFGMSLSFLFALPLIGSFAFPIAVVGGTLLYARAKGSVTLPRLY